MPELRELHTFTALDEREWVKADVAQSYAQVYAKAADIVAPSLVEELLEPAMAPNLPTIAEATAI